MTDQGKHNRYINNAENYGPNAQPQAHMVQCPGCPAAPLCAHPVANVVGFTGLGMKKDIFLTSCASSKCVVRPYLQC